MKYSRLSLQDLKDLENEFIQFLVINGITAPEWEKIKSEKQDNANKIIDHFSDVIWEGVLRKTKMVELRESLKVTVCLVDKNNIYTLIIKSKNMEFCLTKQEDVEKILKEIGQHEISVQMSKLTKPPSEQLFDLLKNGFFLTKNKDYECIIRHFINE